MALDIGDNIIQFTDTSTGNVNEWYWTFGDGTHSYEQNPLHEYEAPGIYTVTLNASNQYQYDTYTTTIIVTSITFQHAPEANFKPSYLNVITNTSYTVNFTNLTYPVYGVTYLWDFGDGGSSIETNPSHTYALGIYDVSLTTLNSWGISSITYNDCIKIHNRAKRLKDTFNSAGTFGSFDIGIYEEEVNSVATVVKAKVFTDRGTYIQGEFPSTPGMDEFGNYLFFKTLNEFGEQVFNTVTEHMKRIFVLPIMSKLGFEVMRVKQLDENLTLESWMETE